jgi:peptidoglycan/LPS O-acetylase OafA/YrhL
LTLIITPVLIDNNERYEEVVEMQGLIRLDAAFEAALGAVLVAGVALGWLGSEDFAAPATTGAVAAFGVVLLGLAVALWRFSSVQVTPAQVAVLAALNGATALIAAVWGLTTDGFSTAGEVLVWVTVTSLAVLAGAQARRSGLRGGEPFHAQR